MKVDKVLVPPTRWNFRRWNDEDCKIMKNAIKKIIEAKAVLAPMSGITDIPFRMMARKFGCKFAFTEMIDVNGIFYKNLKTFKLMDRVPGDTPLGVQFVGQDVEKLVYAAKVSRDKGFSVLDINAGCPARKVVKTGKGAALMQSADKFGNIMRKVVKAAGIPVTVKIRSGWDDDNLNYVEIGKIAEDAGAAAICVHARTKEKMYKGKPDHEVTANLKKALKIPVFASGNIFTAQDAKEVLTHTASDAVFVARGALGRPWIFDEINKCLNGEDEVCSIEFGDLKGIVKEHFSQSVRYSGGIVTLKRMYKHLAWYLKGYKNLNEVMKEYRNVKDLESFEMFMERLYVEEKNHLKF